MLVWYEGNMSITSQLSDQGKILTIAIQGRFDFSALQNFRNAYEKVNPKPREYIIDLKDAEYLDSSALGMLLALRDYGGGDEAQVSVTTVIQM